ncbi:FliO/MopB family protein, partial [Helicobacter bilis]
HIATPLGSLSIKQDSILKHAYIEFSKDTALQSATLISHDKKVYLVSFNAIPTSTDTLLTKDSDIKNLLEESSYEISSWRYFLVLGIMVAILILLYVIKLRQNRGIETSSIVLEQAKILDSKNKIALIRYGEKRYLIGINPHGITLLDSIQHDTQTDKTNDMESSPKQQSFTQILSENLLSKQSKRQ